MFEPVKVGFSQFLTGYYNNVVPTTKPLIEYITRGVGKSINWAPSRMVDSAIDVLDSWQRNDTDSSPTQPAKLPVIIVAMAKDYTPTGRDFTRQITENFRGILDGDTKERYFGIKTIAGDIRTQLFFIAADEPTAKSLAAQFCLFLDHPGNRRFDSNFTFAGIDNFYPTQIEAPDMPVSNIQNDTKNITILAVDLTLKCTIPLFDAPKVGEPNDGKGVPGTNDPAGYPLVTHLNLVPWAGDVD